MVVGCKSKIFLFHFLFFHKRTPSLSLLSRINHQINSALLFSSHFISTPCSSSCRDEHQYLFMDPTTSILISFFLYLLLHYMFSPPISLCIDHLHTFPYHYSFFPFLHPFPPALPNRFCRSCTSSLLLCSFQNNMTSTNIFFFLFFFNSPHTPSRLPTSQPYLI